VTSPPTITIPRLLNERNERYEARVAYLVAGAGRDLRVFLEKHGPQAEKLTPPEPVVEEVAAPVVEEPQAEPAPKQRRRSMKGKAI
jgi:hypothetical protein